MRAACLVGTRADGSRYLVLECDHIVPTVPKGREIRTEHRVCPTCKRKGITELPPRAAAPRVMLNVAAGLLMFGGLYLGEGKRT